MIIIINDLAYLQGKILGYERRENFEKVVKHAVESCEISGIEVSNHFREATKIITIGAVKEKRMKIQKALKILGYISIIEGIISAIVLFITTIMDEDLAALGMIGTLCFSVQIAFFSIIIGFICLAISTLFSQKKNNN